MDVTIGYIPDNLSRTIHLVSGSSAQSAADDLTLLDNNYFGTLVPDIQLLYPAAFGDGLVLTPHTYYMNGTTTLNFKIAIKSNFEASLIVQN